MSETTEEATEPVEIPQDLDAAVAALKAQLDPEAIEAVKAMSRDDAGAKGHHGIGRWIRNNWGFWKKEGPLYEWMTERGFEHADDMSSVVIDAFWCDLAGQELDVDELQRRFNAHWHPKKSVTGIMEDGLKS